MNILWAIIQRVRMLHEMKKDRSNVAAMWGGGGRRELMSLKRQVCSAHGRVARPNLQVVHSRLRNP